MSDTVVSRSPFDGEIVASFASASQDEIDRAVEWARAGALTWARATLERRSTVLEGLADQIDAGAEELTRLVVAETGKRLEEAAAEVEWTAVTARWYAANPPRDETVADARVRAVPLGVVAAITPWNAPLITPAWKLCPALMAGNAVLWKPSSLATASASRLVEMISSTAIPEGVVHLLPGSGDVGAALASDPRIDAIHFTGSTAVGRRIAAVSGERLARCALELGGSNPAVVLEDADLGAAAAAIAESVFAVNGQKCTATRRVIAHEDVAAELIERIRDVVEPATPGDPADPETAIGPLITSEARGHADDVVARAVDAGAEVLARAAPGEGVAAFAPVVLGGLPPEERLRREELFAPVVVIESARGDDEAVRIANATPYGLSAAVHTTDPERGRVIGEAIEAGVIGLNRRTDAVDIEPPFAGRKQSGNGVPEGGTYAYQGVAERQAMYGFGPVR